MAPRPLNEPETINFSASCSSSSSSSSSFDRPRRNESTNSSSSLILILESPESHELRLKNARIEKNLSNSDEHDFNTEECRMEAPRVGFSGKVATSSLENLAKKRANSTRCRRKRSSASPRNNHRNRTLLNEKITNETNNSIETATTGFVATSTMMKNRDCSALSVSTNSSRSAEKVRLQSSVCTNSTALSKNHERVFTLSTPEMRNVATIESQQSTISIAAIRGTNLAFDSYNNDNKNKNNCTKAATNFPLKVRCVPSASAPSLNNNNNNNNNNSNNNNNRVTCLTHASSLHSTSSHSSSVVQLAVASSALSSSSSQRLSGKSRKTKKTSETLTTSASARTSPVRPAAPSYVLVPASPGFATEKSSTTPASLARVDSAISLKSSLSFTSGKVMRKNRVTSSIHASLGQLPISSSCATSATTTTVGEATSLENMENKNNADSNFAPITLYSTNAMAGNSKNVSSNAIGRNSLERVCFANGASTMSSSFSRTPLQIIALPEINNSANNVVNSFRNSLITSGNSNNNNHNNGRCNHTSGTCTGACSGTTITSHTSSTLTRTPNIVTGVATSSSCTNNNSAEQETDYVVDPVQGNAYHKGQFLGKGGFARVYLMTDVANGNQYACKIIPKNRMQKIHIQKIAREIMIHKELNHVNVVQMHHYFEDNINVYMLLEPCPRKSLMHVLKYRGKVTEPEARYYMKQMVTGVAYIHSQKVVHRDLKPGNMFLSDGMIVKIGDFGLATRPDGQRRRVTICGTPNYIAPEVLYKQAYSYEADVWALGCILYALLAGQPPFDTATLKETYARICNNRYKKLEDGVVSRSGQDLIRWLLQPIPELRPSLERVKEHAYLTMEYVPTKLPHTCCYRIPALHSMIPDQMIPTIDTQQIGLSGDPMISRGLISSENIDRSKREISNSASITKNQHPTSNLTTTMSQAHLDPTRIINLTKKPKVGNWLLRKLPKLPKFRQRLSKLLCPDNKKPDSSMMHRALESCLAEIRCTRTQENPMLVDRIVPLFVTKWIDYSNKYGLGFQLSDRSVGVLFNDSTKMSYTHDRTRVEYATTDDEVMRYRREKDVPSSMEEKLELLRHFTHYMDNFLTNGGEVKEQRATKFSRTNSSSVPRMRRWLRTDKAIVMELTVPLLQVNFFVDHSKIVVSEGTRGRGYLVTYIDASREASSYWLNDLRDVGCTIELYERLNYVCKVIAELENDAIFESANATVTNHARRKTLRT